MKAFSLLFESGTVLPDKPVFTSQVDLANEIESNKGPSASTSRPFLNQIINRKSKLSTKYRGYVIRAFTSRVKRELSKKAFELKLDEFKSSLDKLASLPTALDDNNDNFALRLAAKNSNLHFITTFRPAETIHSEQAIEFQSELIERLDLLGKQKDQNENKTIFYISIEEEAVGLWRAIYNNLISRGLPESKASSQLQKADLEGRLEVWVAPRVLGAFPTVVFNPNRLNVQGFSLYYFEDHTSAAAMSPEALDEWRDNVYLPLTTYGGLFYDKDKEEFASEDCKCRRVRWDDPKVRLLEKDND